MELKVGDKVVCTAVRSHSAHTVTRIIKPSGNAVLDNNWVVDVKNERIKGSYDTWGGWVTVSLYDDEWAKKFARKKLEKKAEAARQTLSTLNISTLSDEQLNALISFVKSF